MDFHPEEPWILSALYSGHIFIWNYNTRNLLKSFEVCTLPLRCAKFVPHKQWIIVGSDDNNIRVYNYNTLERVAQFEAHTDYIRNVTVHPTLPYVISTADDMTMKMWNWDKNWELAQTFEGHSHYVMQVEFNPKDTNVFASASLDKTVKVWGLNSSTSHFTLDGHKLGVNCVSYFRGVAPYLASGGDDFLIKVWDYQTKTCLATIDGHTGNVSSVMFHPVLSVIISGSEDGTVKIWHNTTYKLENNLNYGMERAWSISCLRGSNKVALGYDEGTVMIKLGQEEPVMSMNKGGKVVWARNSDMFLTDVKADEDEKEEIEMKEVKDIVDGEPLQTQVKELDAIDIYPHTLMHNPNGRLLVACGDGEYVIYTGLNLTSKAFGSALEFVWASHTKVTIYGTREGNSKVNVFKNFQEHKSFRPDYNVEGIHGGKLLGVRSSEAIDFYDWEQCRFIRRVDVCPKKVFWSDTGTVCVLCCESSFYLLSYNSELVQKYFDQGLPTDEGIEDAFELEQEIPEKVRNGYFVGDCFIYVNGAGRLNYFVGGEVITLAHLSKHMYLLGYIQKENRVYLMDKANKIFSYSLLVNVLSYQTAIVRKEFGQAAELLKTIPKDNYNKLARFLDAQNLKDMALEVSIDPEHRFELAMQVNKPKLAFKILETDPDVSEHKWKVLGDSALNLFDLGLAEECFKRSRDLGGLLLIYSSTCNAEGMSRLAEMARSLGRNNIAFISLFLLNRVDDCVSLLCETGRVAEAAFLTRTYRPSKITDILSLWRADLSKISVKAAEALADPSVDQTDSFEEVKWGLTAEEWVKRQGGLLPASSYLDCKGDNLRNLIQELIQGKISLQDPPRPTPELKKTPALTPKATSVHTSSPTTTAGPAVIVPVKSPVAAKSASPSPLPVSAKSTTPTPAPKAAVAVDDDDILSGGIDDVNAPVPSIEELNSELADFEESW